MKKQLIKGCRCITCYGCNKLEDEDFRGSFRCDRYICGYSEKEKKKMGIGEAKKSGM